PDSEEKVIQHLIIEIVHEKNQKKWKLLTDKKGRFFQKAQSDSSRPGSAVERLRSLVGFVSIRVAPSSAGGRSRCIGAARVAWVHAHKQCAPSAGQRVPRAPTPRQ